MHWAQLPAMQCATAAEQSALVLQAGPVPAPAAPFAEPPRSELPPCTLASGPMVTTVPPPPPEPAPPKRSMEPVTAFEQAAVATRTTLRISQRLEDERLGFIASKPVRVVCQITTRLSNRFLASPAPIERAEAIDASILGEWRIGIAR
jgi:hypothetical protein